MVKSQLDELKELAEWSQARQREAAAEVERQERAADRRRAWVGVALHLTGLVLGVLTAAAGLPAGSGWGWVGLGAAVVNAVMLSVDVARLVQRSR